MKKTFNKLVLSIDNINEAQAIALIKTFEYMQILGNVWASRMCSFYADWDWDFHPKVSYEYPIVLPEIDKDIWCPWNYDKERNMWKDITKWEIDYDKIAWRIYH